MEPSFILLEPPIQKRNNRIVAAVKLQTIGDNKQISYSKKPKQYLSLIEDFEDQNKTLSIETSRALLKQNKKYVFTQSPDPSLPDQNQRDVLFIVAPSGSGKSVYLMEYAKNYKQTFPENEIYILSSVGYDKAVDLSGLEITRIVLDDNFILKQETDPIDISKFKDSLVIFDDTTTISNHIIKKMVHSISEKLLQTGRHTQTCVVITAHIFKGHVMTNTVNFEATSVTFFPSSGVKTQAASYLKTYVGSTQKEIEEIMKIKSKWITVFKTAPQFILWETGVKLL